MAKRVTESRKQTTCLPSSRKCSATASVSQAARLLRGAASSDVAVTMTDVLQAFSAQRVLDEFANLAATFADQADHDHIRFRAPREHRHDRRLADARSREHAQTLPARARRKHVDRLDAQRHLLIDTRAGLRIRRDRPHLPRLPARPQRDPCHRAGSANASITRPSQRIRGPHRVEPRCKEDRRARPEPVERSQASRMALVALEAHEFAARPVSSTETNRRAEPAVRRPGRPLLSAGLPGR